jgi:hypothetical protein
MELMAGTKIAAPGGLPAAVAAFPDRHGQTNRAIASVFPSDRNVKT